MKIFALDLENISPEIWISSYRENNLVKMSYNIYGEFWVLGIFAEK